MSYRCAKFMQGILADKLHWGALWHPADKLLMNPVLFVWPKTVSLLTENRGLTMTETAAQSMNLTINANGISESVAVTTIEFFWSKLNIGRALCFQRKCPLYVSVHLSKESFSINPPIIKILCRRAFSSLFSLQPLGDRKCLASPKWECAAEGRREKGGVRNEWSVGNGGEGVEGPIEVWGARMLDIIPNACLRIHVWATRIGLAQQDWTCLTLDGEPGFYSEIPLHPPVAPVLPHINV